MNAQEWQDCLDVRDFLGGKSNPRQVQLFLCACARRVCHLAQDERCEQALAVAERFADGRATVREHQQAATLAGAVCDHWALRVIQASPCLPALFGAADAAHACYRAVVLDPHAVEFAVRAAADQAAWESRDYPLTHPLLDPEDPHLIARRAERAAQWPLLEDIFGLPVPVPVISPSWLTANGGEVSRLARAIYKEARFGGVHLLAGALERAGCDDPDLLSHCRAPHGHVRGCWLLDLLLGLGGQASGDIAPQTCCYLLFPDASCSARALLLPVGQTCSAGRSPDSDLVLENQFVSRWHCAFGRDDTGVWVEDTQSQNGTFLGAARLDHNVQRRLHSGDEVRICDARVRLLAVDPAWLFWNEGTVPRLAEGIGREMAFERLPILADALEEAGCTEEALLAHCRSQGEHNSDCWALEVLRAPDASPSARLPGEQ
jgi:hypothetical protein